MPPLPRRRLLAGGGTLLAGAVAATLPRVQDRSSTRSPYDWPMPRFDPAGTAHNPAASGPTAAPTERWRLDVSEWLRRSTTPIRLGDTLYVAGDGLVAADADTGVRRFHADGPYASQPARVETDVYRSATLAVTSGAGAFGVHADGGLELPALDRTVWNERWAGPDAGTSRLGVEPSTPVATDGTVYTGVPGTNDVVALEASSGALAWRRTFFEDGITSVQVARPAVRDDTVFAATSYEVVAAFDAETGTRRWHRRLDGRRPLTPTATDEGLIVPLQRGVVLLDPADGATVWERAFEGHGTDGGAAVADGTVFVGTDSLVALDLATGERRWSADVNTGDGHPVVADGTVYVGGGSAVVSAFDADTGTEQFTHRAEVRASRPIPGDGALALVDGTDLVVLEGSA